MSLETAHKENNSANLQNKRSIDFENHIIDVNKYNKDGGISVQDKTIETILLNRGILENQAQPNIDQSPHLKENDILIPNYKVISSKAEENSEANQICRVCFESGSKFKRLISPCMCSGSLKYIHEDCLNKWLESIEIWTSDQFPKCELCKYKFEAIFYFKKVVSKDQCTKVTKHLLFSAVILLFLSAAVSVTIFTIVQAIKKYDDQKKLTFAKGLIIGSILIVIILLIANYCRIKKKMYDKHLEKWRILNYSESIEFSELDQTKNALGKVTHQIEYPYIFFKNYEILT